MLNTQSRSASLLIWLVILAIVAQFVWSFWSLPAPGTLVAGLLQTEIAAFAARNQVLIAGLGGFGGASLAYLVNGWRDRAERRHALERMQKRAGAVLAQEARDMASACSIAARSLSDTSPGAAQVLSELTAATTAGDHALLSASAMELSRLGPGASAAVRGVRASVRRTATAIAAARADEPQGLRTVATRARETAATALAATHVFDALAKGGIAAADKARPIAVEAGRPADAPAGARDEAIAGRIQSAA